MRRRAADPDAVAADVERLAALVSAGATQPAAWRYLAAGSVGGAAELAGRVAEAAARGDPLAPVFAAADPLWRRVGSVVGLAAETGAPLGSALRGAARGARSAAELQRAVATSVAGPAASARLVLILPPATALLGWAFGFDVPRVLLGTPVGAVLLVVGVALLVGAAAWGRRLIRAASRSSPSVALPVELVAVAVRAGLPVPAARGAAGRAVMAAGLTWDEDAEIDRLLGFAADAGIPVAALLEAEADRQHRVAIADAGVRSTVLAVRLLLPLGALVLPAFLLLGAAPVGIAILTSTTVPL